MDTPQIQTKYQESFNFLQLRKKRQAEQLKLLSNLRRGEQNISSTLILTLFNRIMSNTYDDKMQVKFLPSQGINQDQINSYNILAQSDYQEMGKAKLDYDWTWDTLFFGRGFMETVRFDTKRKILQPHVINPLNFGYDPYIEEVQSWRYYWKWITKSKDELKLLQKAGVLKDFNIDSLPSGIEPYLWQYKITRDQARDAVAPPIDSVDADVYQILEFYGHKDGEKWVFWTDKNFSKVLYERKLDFDDGDEIIAPDGTGVKKNSNWPIIVKESFRVPHSSVPVSVADLLEDKHRAKAVLLNLAYIAAKDQANPLYWYDPAKVQDVAQFLSRQINQHIPVEGDGALAVGPIQKASAMTQDLISFIQMMDAEAEEPIGTGKPMQNASGKGDQTATQAALDQQLNDVAQSLQSKVMQFGEQEFWGQWFHRYAKHADELKTKMANIVGVNGVTTHIIDMKDFNTDYPPGVLVYSAKEAEYKELVLRRDLSQALPVLIQSMDADGLRNFYKHVYWPKFLQDPSLIDVMFPKTMDEMNAEAENEQLADNMMPDVKETDNHTTHIYTHMMLEPKTWAGWTHIHWHQELLAQQLAQQQKQSGGQGSDGKNKVSESISYKDLPPEGQQQMAQQAGITISTPPPLDKQTQGGQTNDKAKPKSSGVTINIGKEKQNPKSAASPLKTEVVSNNAK